MSARRASWNVEPVVVTSSMTIIVCPRTIVGSASMDFRTFKIRAARVIFCCGTVCRIRLSASGVYIKDEPILCIMDSHSMSGGLYPRSARRSVCIGTGASNGCDSSSPQIPSNSSASRSVATSIACWLRWYLSSDTSAVTIL